MKRDLKRDQQPYLQCKIFHNSVWCVKKVNTCMQMQLMPWVPAHLETPTWLHVYICLDVKFVGVSLMQKCTVYTYVHTYVIVSSLLGVAYIASIILIFIHESSWCLPVCRCALCVRGSLGEACCATLILTYLIQDCMQKRTVTVTVTPAVLHSSFTLKRHPHIDRTGNAVHLLEANVGGTPSSLNHMDAQSGLILCPNIA